MEIGVEGIRDIKITNLPEGGEVEVVGTMSMAVEKIEGYYQSLYRELHRPKVEQPILHSVLSFAWGKDGIDFERSGVAVYPGVEPESIDRLAVEDPTIVKDNGQYYVFHSAVKPRERGVSVAIQMVKGKSLESLDPGKNLILLPETVGKEMGIEDVDMVKEPEFFLDREGQWNMIFEFTGQGRSHLGIAVSRSLEGPYKNFRKLFEQRPAAWDSIHLSPGPIIPTPSGDFLMFYNGCGAKSETDKTPTWGIGYAIIDSARGNILQRSDLPIIRPPEEIGPGNQLISFANSVVTESGFQKLYYTIADKRSAVASLAVNF